MSSVIEAQLQNNQVPSQNTLKRALTSNLTLNNSQKINYQSFDKIKSPQEQDAKVPFKNSMHINRAERLQAKEMREQNMNAVLQESWKCKCMLASTKINTNKDIKIIDHLQKRNCQECGAFIIGIGSEDEESPLRIKVSDNRNGNSATKVISCVENSQSKQKSLQKNDRYNVASGQKQKQSNTKVKALKQKEDHFFADMSPSEIYSYLRLEESSQRFKQSQGRFIALTPQTLKIRKQLVEWIFDIGEKVKQRILTIHLAVVYLDILIQDDKIFEKIKQEVLPCVCILLASKFDELDDNIPLIRELQKVCAKQKVIPYDDVVKAEQAVLFQLNWDLFKLTPMHFLQNLLGQGIVFTNDKVQVNKLNTTMNDIDEKTLKSVRKHAEFFTDLSIQEYELQRQFKPSVVAISCIVLARKMSKIVPEWNDIGLEELTDYTYDGEVRKCTDRIYKIYQKQFGIVSNKTPNCKISLQQSNGKSDNRSNKHNKENLERIRAMSGSNRESLKHTVNNNQTSQNTIVTKVQLVKKPQIIEEEAEPSRISHNTTRSNESSDIMKANPQFNFNDYLDPYQLFDQSQDKVLEQISLRCNKPQSTQQPQKMTNESKITLSNSYQSDLQSPSLQILENQVTVDNSKVPSQSRIRKPQQQNRGQRTNNHSQIRKQETSVNPLQRRISNNNHSIQNTQQKSQNAASQRNISKTRSQPGLSLQSNLKQVNQQHQIINPVSFSSAIKLNPPQSTKNQSNECSNNQSINNNPKKTKSTTLLSCRNNTNVNLSTQNNHTTSRNGGNALQLNGVDNICSTMDGNSTSKVSDTFLSQKSQVSKKQQSNTNITSAPYSNRASQTFKNMNRGNYQNTEQSMTTPQDFEILSSQTSHRHQLSMVPSSSQLTNTTMNRPAKKSMDFTTKNKKLDTKPQTTKNSNNFTSLKKPISQIKVNQDLASMINITSNENSLTRLCVFDTQQSQQQNSQSLNNFKPIHSNYDKYQSQDNSKTNSTQMGQNKIFDRKKSSALRNTTLEEIYENKQENFIISPTKQYAVYTTKNSNNQGISGNLQSFSMVSYNQGNLNHIQRNKAYINQLNKRVKERKLNEQGGISSLMTSQINSKSTTNIFVSSQNQKQNYQNEKQKSTSKLYHASTNPYNSSTTELKNENNQYEQQQEQLNQIQSSQASQNVSAIMGFNSRRASDFNQCDYLRPTLSSMCRAKSVISGIKKTNTKPKINQVQNKVATEESTQFEITSKLNDPSPKRAGPIQVYDKNKSIQKRQSSGFRRPQFRDDQSHERLRISQYITSNITQTQQEQQNTIARLSLGKQNSVNPTLMNKQQQQSRLENKTQRNSVSLSFNQNLNTISTQQDDSVRSNKTNKMLATYQTNKSCFLNKQQKQQPQKKQSSNNNLNFSTQYQDTQQSSVANLLSQRSIGGAAIIEEDEHDEIMHSHPTISQFENEERSQSNQERYIDDDDDDDENNHQETHQFNFEDVDDTIIENIFQGDQHFGNKSITHVISSLPDDSSQQFDDDESLQREDTQQPVNSSIANSAFNQIKSITSSIDSNKK